MNKKKAVVCLVVAFLFVAALIFVFAKERNDWLYEARGMFYFGLYGREMESLSIQDWSGPDRLWMFKEFLWDKRPGDFGQRVLQRLQGAYHRKGNGEAAVEAIKSISFHRVSGTFDRFELSVVASDSSLATDVANASMEVIADLDLEGEKSRKEKMVKQLAYECEQRLKARNLLEEKSGEAKSESEKINMKTRVAQLSQSIDHLKDLIAIYQGMDVRTNTMFKIMIPAGMTTNVVAKKIAPRETHQP